MTFNEHAPEIPKGKNTSRFRERLNRYGQQEYQDSLELMAVKMSSGILYFCFRVQKTFEPLDPAGVGRRRVGRQIQLQPSLRICHIPITNLFCASTVGLTPRQFHSNIPTASVFILSVTNSEVLISQAWQAARGKKWCWLSEVPERISIQIQAPSYISCLRLDKSINLLVSCASIWTTADLIQGMLPASRACVHVFPFTARGFWGSQDWALTLAKGPPCQEVTFRCFLSVVSPKKPLLLRFHPGNDLVLLNMKQH